MALGEQIRQRRKQRGLSQEGLAQLVGVSRQAVAKWEADRSAPSTENLLQLAALFETTVEALAGLPPPAHLENAAVSATGAADVPARASAAAAPIPPAPSQAPAPEAAGSPSSAEEFLRLYQAQLHREREARRAGWKARLLTALGIGAGYLLCYVVGVLLGGWGQQRSLAGIVLSPPATYLLGWLAQEGLFWVCLALSAAAALWGKPGFALTTLYGFAAGLLLGELLGPNPTGPGAAYGQTHFGWAIWGGVFLLSVVLGALLEWLRRRPGWAKRLSFRLWCAAVVAGPLVVAALVRFGTPPLTGH